MNSCSLFSSLRSIVATNCQRIPCLQLTWTGLHQICQLWPTQMEPYLPWQWTLKPPHLPWLRWILMVCDLCITCTAPYINFDVYFNQWICFSLLFKIFEAEHCFSRFASSFVIISLSSLVNFLLFCIIIMHFIEFFITNNCY